MTLLNYVRDAVRGTVPHRVFRSLVPSTFVAPPPYEVKREIIVEHGRRFGLRYFVETGTFLGETVEACLPHFDRLHTIELAEPLYREAAARLAGERRVNCHLGHSPDRLAEILPLPGPALFWLDAHYSGCVEKDGRNIQTARGTDETPIMDELEVILARCAGRDVILIDDARAFDGTGGYPTVAEIESRVRSHRPAAVVEVREDIVRIYPDGHAAAVSAATASSDGV